MDAKDGVTATDEGEGSSEKQQTPSNMCLSLLSHFGAVLAVPTAQQITL